MTQAATLVADKLNESNAWFRSDNGQPTNVYQMIDEGYPGNDSTDYAGWNEVGSAPGKRMVFKWTTITTPANGNVTLKVRHYANSTTEVRTYEIRQGYVDESTLGTLLGSTTITHTQFAAWESSTPTVAITGATDGSDLYLRVWVSTFGGATLSAITAIDADFPDAQVTHNLSGTPDIFATTPLLTDGGTAKVSWQLTDGMPALTIMTATGTMTTAQGSHTLTDGAPNLTGLTGSGSGRVFWNLTGAPELTRMTATGQETVVSQLQGNLELLPLFRFSGLAAPIVKRIFTDIRAAVEVAHEYLATPQHSFVIYRNFLAVTGGSGGSKYTLFYIVEPLVPHEDLDRAGILIAKDILALGELIHTNGTLPTVYSFNNPGQGYTFIQPQQDMSPKRPCPAADPVNADGDRTERVSYYSRELKVVKHE